MSGQVLSPDAIAALVDAARAGQAVDAPPATGRQRRLRAVDFSRPAKFGAEQERRIRRAIEAFCRTASTRLSAELRVPLELELLTTAQLTWANAHAEVPGDSVAAVVQIPETGTRLAFTSELGVVLQAVELLLGGNTGEPVQPRRLTDIDWALATFFFERALAQLSSIWSDQVGLELQLERLETHLETQQLAPVSEPTLATMIEARIEGHSSTMGILLPWSAIEPVADRFGGQDKTSARPRDEASVRGAVGRVELTVRAEVGGREMAVEDMLALKPGDVLRLGRQADEGATLFAGRVPVHAGRPGRSGGRRAVQVERRIGHDR